MGLLGISGISVLLLVAGSVRAESVVATRAQPVAIAHLDFQITIPRILTLPTAGVCLARLSSSADASANRQQRRVTSEQQLERERLAQRCTVALP